MQEAIVPFVKINIGDITRTNFTNRAARKSPGAF